MRGVGLPAETAGQVQVCETGRNTAKASVGLPKGAARLKSRSPRQGTLLTRPFREPERVRILPTDERRY